MASPKTKGGVEWVGGIAEMGVVAGNDGRPFVSSVLIWLSPDGLVMGLELGRADDLLRGAGPSLRRTLANPKVSPTPAPSAVRVGTPELASALREGDLPVDIVEGPTPEVDRVAAAMRNDLFPELPARANEEPLLYDDAGPAFRDPRIGEALVMFDELVLRRFLESWRRPSWDAEASVRAAMDCAAREIGVPLVLLEEPELRSILFESLPRIYAVDPSEAKQVVTDLKAFFRFAKGEFGEEFSTTGMAVLGGKAVSTLKAALKKHDSGGPGATTTAHGSARTSGRLRKRKKLSSTQLDRLDPIPIQEVGEIHPRELLGSETDASFEPWASEVRARGPRPFVEMESIVPGRDPRDFDDDPIYAAMRLRDDGRVGEGIAQLESLIQADPRCLDAYAHIASFVFDDDVQTALAHYAEGVRIGDHSLAPFGEVFVPWMGLGNRPYLRCLHGLALCLWRLERWVDARAALMRLLWLNPSDNQGARFILPDVEARHPWTPS